MPTQNNWVSKISEFFIKRKQLAFVLFLLLVTLGVTALLGLRREGFPKVPVKIIVINTVYPGAAPGVIEQEITNPIESAVKDLAEVKSLSSTSNSSVSSVVVTLNEDAQADTALQNVTSKISGLDLPEDSEKPQVIQPTTGGSDFVFGLYAPNLSAEQVLAEGKIFARELGNTAGVKQVELAVPADPRINVTFDPAALRRSGVNPATLSEQFASANLDFPAGNNLTIDGKRSTVLVAGQITSLQALSDLRLNTLNGTTVKLGDVATISRVVDSQGKLSRLGVNADNTPIAYNGLIYNVDIRKGADILTVSDHLDETLERLKKTQVLNESVQVVRLFDDAEATREQIQELEAGAIGEKWEGIGPLGYVGYMVGGIWLLMLAMFLFVNLRTALIAGLAIPLSFLVTLIALYLGGYTLNTLTLFAMILVLGLVVDPAIVVLESIQRYKDMGRNGLEGVTAAIGSIGKGLLLATLCSIIVFTPFGIVSGIFGEIIRFIPITVIPALVASFFIPIIFLAPLAGRWVKAHPGATGDEEDALWSVSRWFKTANLYILKRWWLQVVIMLVAFVAPLAVTGYLFASGAVKPAQFSKPNDTTAALVSLTHPAGYTDEQIKSLATQAEQTLAKHNQIKNYYYATQSATGFDIYLTLTPITERSVTAEQLVGKLRDELPKDAGAGIFASAETLSAGTPTPEFPVQLQIFESDAEKLKTFTLALAEYAESLPGVTRVSDGYTDGGVTAYRYTVDQTAASSRGLSAAAIGAQLASTLGEQKLTTLTIDGDTVPVMGSFGTPPTTQAGVNATRIATQNGTTSLTDVAKPSVDGSATTILHQNSQRFASVRAQVSEGTDAADVQQKLNDWADSKLAEYGLADDALTSKGENDDIAESFKNLFAALGIAILMIYLVLALFFGSFLKPIIITFALPLSFLGVFPTLAVLGNEFGFLEILGLITLAGIVVNVGIFVIDYANRKVAEGMPVKEAIAQATAVRFRPIFLTKITALGSLLPLALLSPFWRGLSSVIIAGILTSGILSLFTTPILYTWFEGLSRLPAHFRRWRAGRAG